MSENIPGSLKAFAISLMRQAFETPEIFLQLAELKNKWRDDLKEWYDLLGDDEQKVRLRKNLQHIIQNTDFTITEKTYIKWAEYGWVIDIDYIPVSVSDECPSSCKEADRLMLSYIKKDKLNHMRNHIFRLSDKKMTFNEACKCFDNRCYTACAALLLALIEHCLITESAKSLVKDKKIGIKASELIKKNKENDPFYGEPGIFHLYLLNFHTYISILFENAHGFQKEPNRLNRNYLLHGMNKRNVLRKDCIKLFLAYKQALFFYPAK